MLADDGARARAQCGLEDDPFVRRRHPLHNRFTQPPRAVDDDRITKTGFRIEREHHARAGQIGAHHRLHADGERHLEVVEAARRAIRDGAVSPERSETAMTCFDQSILART